MRTLLRHGARRALASDPRRRLRARAPREVIQYLYRKYGRDRAALTAVVISYRPNSALVADAGLSARDLAVRQLIELTRALIGFPRHLSQHPGGFVLTQGPLSRMVPIENAAMPDRTVIE